jgi:hypothetical protein
MREFPQLGREICCGLNVFIKSLALAPMIEVPMRKFAVCGIDFSLWLVGVLEP